MLSVAAVLQISVDNIDNEVFYEERVGYILRLVEIDLVVGLKDEVVTFTKICRLILSEY